MRQFFIRFIIVNLCFLIMMSSSAVAEVDVKGSQDHPLLTRMPGFYIDRYKQNEFDNYKFKTDHGNIQVEGRKYVIDYRLKKGSTPPGKIQILRNYLNALTGIGAGVKLKSSYYYVFAIAKDDMETWVKVSPENSDGSRYIVTIVERAVMVQAVKANAEAMARGIAQTGHMAVYGIYFDSGKAIVKEDSQASLTEIAKLLKINQTIELYIVGHTDSDGKLDYNMTLSQKRAAAVARALISNYSIDSKRLVPKGLGPLCPVASNRSPGGRAKNRRVELVER